MKPHSMDTPMHKAWEAYQKAPYYEYWAGQAGLDIHNPATKGAMWWMFSKGYEAASETSAE